MLRCYSYAQMDDLQWSIHQLSVYLYIHTPLHIIISASMAHRFAPMLARVKVHDLYLELTVPTTHIFYSWYTVYSIHKGLRTK